MRVDEKRLGRRGHMRECVKRVATAGISAVVAATMAFSAPVAALADAVTENGITIDKTATALDENDQTDVTLKIGGEQDVNNVAVLFVLDYSTSTDVRNAAADFLDELAKKNNTNVKACVINYWSEADAGTWTDIDESTDTDELLEKTKTGGTNYHAGLLAAQKALASNEIDGYETYLITISDGITYLWTDEETGETQSIWYQNRGNGAADIQNGNSVYEMKYHDNAIDSDYFDELVSGSEKVLKQYANTEPFFVSYADSTKPSTGTPANDSTVDGTPYLSYFGEDYQDIMDNYLIGTEVAIYKTAGVWSNLVKDVDYAYAFKLDENHWDQYPYGEQLMDWMISVADNDSVVDLAKGEISATTAATTFETISNQIIYAMQSGVVTDVIGEDFDLAYDEDDFASAFTLTVGTASAQVTDVSDETVDGTRYITVSFDDEDYNVQYQVAADGTETIVWDINVPVESASPIQLTYTLDLVNKSDVAGEYTVPTNKSATLVPNDGKDDTMTFPVPEVTYTVEEEEPTIPEEPTTTPGDGTDDTKVADDATTSDGKLPKTGDPASIASVAVAAMAGLGAIGAGTLVSKRRK